MKLDKTTLIVLAVCMLAMMLTSQIVNKVWPPEPIPEEQLTSLTAGETNATTTAVSPSIGSDTNAAASTITTAASTEAKPSVVPSKERPPEELVELSNDYVRVTLTSWGGGIKSIELLKHPNNGSGNVILNGGDVTPVLVVNNIPGAGEDAAYTMTLDSASRTVTMNITTAEGVTVQKKVTLSDNYLLDDTITVNGQAAPKALQVEVGTATPSTVTELPDYLAAAWLLDNKLWTKKLKNAEKGTAAQPVTEEVNATWVAAKSQFFAMMLTPSTNTTVQAVDFHAVDLPQSPEWKQKKPPRGVATAARLATTETDVDGDQVYTFRQYMGPKEYDRLQELGKGQEQVMDFGLLGVISVILLKSMNFFHGLIPNYGVAIIIITIIIKVIFWPIQAKSIRSMKEMQKFQPLMAKLKEKYKDDPQRMNAEMMKLYKEHKINPFAGCLPMVVQIPVFFALFAMLRTAIELRGAHFLWIHDLSQPDTIAHLAGFALNPLPLAMGATMIWQMKLTPSAGDPKQQQMMMIMPVVFLFICYNMSSGLVLYWTVQQILSIAQQWWSMRQSDNKPGGPVKVMAKA